MKSTTATATKGTSGDAFFMSASCELVEPTNPPPAYTARDNTRSANAMENWTLNDRLTTLIAPHCVSSPPRYPSLSSLYDGSTTVFAVAALHVIAAFIVLFTSIPAIDLYANERNQVHGNGNRRYGIGGSVVAMLSAGFSIVMIVYFKMGNCLSIKPFQVCVYALSGALLGYSTYLVRQDKYCDPRYVYNGECVSVQLSTGWRCGIVAIAMSGVIVLAEIICFFYMFLEYAKGRFRKGHNTGNLPL